MEANGGGWRKRRVKRKIKKHYQRLQMVTLRTQGLTQPAIAAVVERAGL
jgi:hypothetical protein